MTMKASDRKRKKEKRCKMCGKMFVGFEPMCDDCLIKQDETMSRYFKPIGGQSR